MKRLFFSIMLLGLVFFSLFFTDCKGREAKKGKKAAKKEEAVKVLIIQKKEIETQKELTSHLINPWKSQNPDNIDIEFTQKLDEKKLRDVKNSFSISPSANYKLDKIGDNRIRISFPEGLLMGDNVNNGAYNITVLKRIFTINLNDFKVLSVIQDSPKRAIFSIKFNSPVKAGDLKEHLNIDYERGQTRKFKILTKGISRMHRILVYNVDDKKTIGFNIKGLRDFAQKNLIRDYKDFLILNLKSLRIFVTKDKVVSKESGFEVHLTMKEENEKKPGEYKRERIRWYSKDVIPEIDPELFRHFLNIKPRVKFAVYKGDKGYVIKGDFKPKTTYTIKVEKGLRSKNGKLLDKDYSTQIKLGDYKKSLKILSKGHVMPTVYHEKLAIKSMNIETVRVSVRQIYSQNIIYWLTGNRDYSSSNVSDQIFNKKITIPFKVNKSQVFFFDLANILPRNACGVFSVNFGSYDSLQIVISDLGITAKKYEKGTKIWVKSIKNFKEIANAGVKAMSYSNKILAEKNTDQNGFVEFDGIKPYAILVEKGDDLNYIVFDEPLLDLSKQDISGQRYNNKYKYKAYVYTDRGVYRPNDIAHIGIMLRDNEKKAPDVKFPLRIKVLNPLRKVILEKVVAINENGMCELEKEFGNYPRTGKYEINVYFKKDIIGKATFKVEEFAPERLKVDILPTKDIYFQDESVDFKLKGDYLFGAPAGSCKFEVEYSYKPFDLTLKKYPNFKFGRYFFDIPKSVLLNTEKGKLNKNGERELSENLKSNNIVIDTPVRLRINASVFEAGSGRTTKSQKTVTILSTDELIGLKSTDYIARYNKKTHIEGVITDKDGNLITKKRTLHISVKRIEYDWYYYYDRYYDEYNWKWIPYNYEISDETITINNGKFSYDFIPDEYWGAYIVKVESEKDKSVSEIFLPAQWEWRYLGMGSSKRSSEMRKFQDPQYIQVFSDKDTYRLGDKAKISFKARYNGIALFSVETDEVVYSKWLTVKEGENIVEYSINKEVPNVYFNVYFIKNLPNDITNGFQPYHAIGVKSASIVPEKQSVNVKITAPEIIKPRDELTVNLDIDDNGVYYAQISVVDEGILQLTRFKSPDPIKYFFSKCGLDVRSYGNYGWVMGKIPDKMLTGGGDGGEGRGPTGKKRVAPFKIVSFWSGTIKVVNKKAVVKFKIPYFNGKLRIMAVVSGKKKMGSAEKFVTVRDPVLIMPSYPRFFTINDKVRIPISLMNFTGKTGDFKIDLKSNENVDIVNKENTEQKLKNKKELMAYFDAKIKKLSGVAEFTVTASGNGKTSMDTFAIPIIPPIFEQTHIERVKLDQKRNDLTSYFSGWVPDYEKDSVLVNNLPFYNGLLGVKYLVRYPYGCIEQTSSATFPLLYMEDIMKYIDPDFLKDRNIHKMVMHGIDRVLNMQQLNGGFSYWPGGSYGWDWATVYTTHLLLSAKDAGYDVPQSAIDSALNYIENILYYRNYRDYKPYGYFVLAIAGKKHVKNIEKLIEIAKQRNYTEKEEDLVFLGAALVLSGKKEKGLNILTKYYDSIPKYYHGSSSTFYSTLRYLGVKLFIMEKIQPGSEWGGYIADEIAKLLTTHQRFRYYTTQELAWSVLALGQRIKNIKPKMIKKASLKLGDKEYPLKKHGAIFSLTGEGFSAFKPIVLNVSNKGYGFIAINGYPKDISKSYGYNGLKVTINSKTIDNQYKPLKNGYKVGDLGIIEVKLENLTDKKFKNVALVVRIPSGFDIENPRLSGSHVINWMSDNVWKYEHMDIRDDRIQVFGELGYRKTVTFYFAVRATFSGNMTLPGPSAEVMYMPEYYYYGNMLNVEIE